VTAVAQALYVDGYRRADDPDNAAGWAAWQRNGLDARQAAVHRGALAHGLAYATVLPGGGDTAVIRGVSARRMIALYRDPAEDEWPEYAIRADHLRGQKMRWRLYDADAVYTFDGDQTSPEFVTFDVHGAGVCPVIRFANQLDLDGRSAGEVSPLIALAARIDQDTFDRLVVQRFGAWSVRTISGMEMPAAAVDGDGNTTSVAAEKLRLRMEDILVSESPDTKFGTLAGTPLDGYIKARESDIRDLAAVSQTPPDNLLGQMVNLSAEALAAARASLSAKVAERQASFGESWEQTLRLAAHVQGDSEGAEAFDAQVVWRDTEIRSLAQAADALGKLAQMLRVPVQMLWEKIPGWTQQDVERAKALMDDGGFEALIAQLAGGDSALPPAG
jgi:hypothetical protein